MFYYWTTRLGRSDPNRTGTTRCGHGDIWVWSPACYHYTTLLGWDGWIRTNGGFLHTRFRNGPNKPALARLMAKGLGFEPRWLESESSMLPTTSSLMAVGRWFEHLELISKFDSLANCCLKPTRPTNLAEYSRFELEIGLHLYWGSNSALSTTQPILLAELLGFEPRKPFGLAVFKTAGINHSPTIPGFAV